jgi:hypothetical protein
LLTKLAVTRRQNVTGVVERSEGDPMNSFFARMRFPVAEQASLRSIRTGASSEANDPVEKDQGCIAQVTVFTT